MRSLRHSEDALQFDYLLLAPMIRDQIALAISHSRRRVHTPAQVPQDLGQESLELGGPAMGGIGFRYGHGGITWPRYIPWP
jgi:hypothetical protein